MKMKWKQVLYSLIFGVGVTMSMTGCTDSENIGPGTDPDDENLPEGYFSFQSGMLSSDGNKRAVTEEEASAPENKVARIRIIFYDDVTNIAEYAYEYSGEFLHKEGHDFMGSCMLDKKSPLAPGGYEPGVDGFMPQAMKLKMKDYKLVVMANPSDNVVALTTAQKEYVNILPTATPVETQEGVKKYEDFKNAVATVGVDVLMSPDFFMSNSQDYVVGKEQIKTDVNNAYKSPVNIGLDRAVSKVKLTINDKIADNSNGFIKLTGGAWKLDITNKSTYWLRHTTFALGGTTHETINTSRENRYAEDPNYDLYSWERYDFHEDPKPNDLVTNNGNLITNYFNYITKAQVNQEYGTHEYALENTMTALEQYKDVTTAAILKINYIPKQSSIGAVINDNSSYFVYKQFYVFTAAELASIKANPLNPSDKNYAVYNELKEFLTLNEGKLEAPSISDPTAPGFPGGFGAGYTAPGSISKKIVGLEDLIYNADGVNYYRILIRHFNNSQEPRPMGHGRYGVVRNNVYKLDVAGINRPGDIDVPKPVGPNEDDMMLGVSFKIEPWLVRDQTVIIE